jgi:hypothetical protein
MVIAERIVEAPIAEQEAEAGRQLIPIDARSQRKDFIDLIIDAGVDLGRLVLGLSQIRGDDDGVVRCVIHSKANVARIMLGRVIEFQ